MNISKRTTYICELTEEEFHAIPAFRGRNYDDLRPFVQIIIGGESNDFWLGFKNFCILDFGIGTFEKVSDGEILEEAKGLIDSDYFVWDNLPETYDKDE